MAYSQDQYDAYNKWATDNTDPYRNENTYTPMSIDQWASLTGATQQDPAAAEAKRVADMKAQGLNADGSPIAPDFIGATNPDGTLQDKFKLPDWQTVNPDTKSLDLYNQTAQRAAGTNSPWAAQMLQKQQAEQQQAADQAGAGASNTMLQAVSRLAQSGGVSGGARERLMRQGAQSGFIGRQGVERQGLLDRAGLLAKDEENRMAGLQTSQNMGNQQADIKFKNQQQQANMNQYNTTNLFKSTDAQNQFNQNKWNKNMEVWGAGKTADAQKASSGGGGGKK